MSGSALFLVTVEHWDLKCLLMIPITWHPTLASISRPLEVEYILDFSSTTLSPNLV